MSKATITLKDRYSNEINVRVDPIEVSKDVQEITGCAPYKAFLSQGQIAKVRRTSYYALEITQWCNISGAELTAVVYFDLD